MKIVMVNDCAFVGETLIKFFPKDVEVLHLKRSRGLWDKTFGIAWKILRADADVFHVNYLLQDCYLALKFGKRPLLGHAHGSDLRVGLTHWAWSRIVRHNLQHCDKVLVSTPDIAEIAKKYRADATYLPNPVDTTIFHPEPFRQKEERLRVLIASECDWKAKGTDVAIRALDKLKENVEVSIIRYGKDFEATKALADSLELSMHILPKVPHQDLPGYYWNADVVLDQFRYGVLGMISLEAIACGRPVITNVSSEYSAYRDFPLKDLNSVGNIVDAFGGELQGLWEREYEYFERNHRPEEAAEKMDKIYADLL